MEKLRRYADGKTASSSHINPSSCIHYGLPTHCEACVVCRRYISFIQSKAGVFCMNQDQMLSFALPFFLSQAVALTIPSCIYYCSQPTHCEPGSTGWRYHSLNPKGGDSFLHMNQNVNLLISDKFILDLCKGSIYLIYRKQ